MTFKSALFLMAGLLLTGCQTVPFSVYEVPDMVVYDRSEVPPAVSKITSYGSRPGLVLDPNTIAFFSENDFGRKWISRSQHKAIAIGYPETCATYNSTWKYGSRERAVEIALSECLIGIQELNRHTGKSCGCQIAAVDNNLLISPERLPFRRTLPAIALVKDTKGRREILGYAKTTGRTGENQPMDFYTANDRKVCQGHYSIGSLSFKGDAQLSCFDGKIEGPAVFRVAGFREGQAYGTALLKSGDNELILVYGLPTEEFRKRRSELLGQ